MIFIYLTLKDGYFCEIFLGMLISDNIGNENISDILIFIIVSNTSFLIDLSI